MSEENCTPVVDRNARCYYDDINCTRWIWPCKTCGEWYCSFHWHETSMGRNVECVTCESARHSARPPLDLETAKWLILEGIVEDISQWVIEGRYEEVYVFVENSCLPDFHGKTVDELRDEYSSYLPEKEG